jgi:hypothetical protein
MPDFMQRKRDKKQNSFADQARYFKELPNELSLKDKLDSTEKKSVDVANKIPSSTLSPITVATTATTPSTTISSSTTPIPMPTPTPSPISPTLPPPIPIQNLTFPSLELTVYPSP